MRALNCKRFVGRDMPGLRRPPDSDNVAADALQMPASSCNFVTAPIQTASGTLQQHCLIISQNSSWGLQLTCSSGAFTPQSRRASMPLARQAASPGHSSSVRAHSCC